MLNVQLETTTPSVHVTQVSLEMQHQLVLWYHHLNLLSLILIHVIQTHVDPTVNTEKSMESVSVPVLQDTKEIHPTADQSVL